MHRYVLPGEARLYCAMRRHIENVGGVTVRLMIDDDACAVFRSLVDDVCRSFIIVIVAGRRASVDLESSTTLSQGKCQIDHRLYACSCLCAKLFIDDGCTQPGAVASNVGDDAQLPGERDACLSLDDAIKFVGELARNDILVPCDDGVLRLVSALFIVCLVDRCLFDRRHCRNTRVVVFKRSSAR